MAEYRYLGEPHPEWADFPNNLPEGTAHYNMTRDKLPIRPQSGLDIGEFDHSVRDGFPIRIRSYRQSYLCDSRPPVLVYMHGGGYVTGSLETDDKSCRAISSALEVVVLSIDYRLAPEHQFPVGFEDCHDIVRWIGSLEGARALNIDPRKGFILGGTSAGANFTAGISHLVRDENMTYPLTAVMFLAGSFCHPDVHPAQYRDRLLSINEILDAPGLTRKAVDYFAKEYGAPPSDPRYSPLLFQTHDRLAVKAYFAVCGWDPRRDDGLLLADLVHEAGVITRVDVYPGLSHGFWTTCPDLPVAAAFEKDLLEGVRWLLTDSVGESKHHK